METENTKQIRDSFGFQSVVFDQTVSRGFTADNFIITADENKYFFKIYSPKRDIVRVGEMHAVENFFATHGVPVIAPIAQKDGSDILHLGDRLGALFPYVVGKQFSGLPSIEAARSAGALLGRMHQVGANHSELVPGRGMDKWDGAFFSTRATAIIEKINSESKTEYSNMARQFVELKMSLAQKTAATIMSLGLIPDTLLHNDYHHHNLFFDEQDRVTHVFDFERVCYGDRYTELAYAIFFIAFDFNNEFGGDISDAHYRVGKAFIEGYRNVLSITTDRFLKGVEWFFEAKLVHDLGPAGMHYLEGNTRFDALIQLRLHRLQYFSDLKRTKELLVSIL